MLRAGTWGHVERMTPEIIIQLLLHRLPYTGRRPEHRYSTKAHAEGTPCGEAQWPVAKRACTREEVVQRAAQFGQALCML